MRFIINSDQIWTNMEEASKDVHYFLTTLTSAFTLFAGYQVGKSQYKISQKRKNIRQL